MVRGQPLSDDLRKVILHMAKHLDVASIPAVQRAPSNKWLLTTEKPGAIMYIYTVLVN